MAVTVAASRLGTAAYDQSPVELRAHFSRDDADVVIRAVYRQVLGNDYVMSSERLVGAESLLQNGLISVRDFVRAVAQSELYKQKFLYPNFQTRAIELNFKHLLGRAPYSEAEVIEHLDRYQNEGFDADISSYIDGNEYTESFGDNVVPYLRDFEYRTSQQSVGFTRLVNLSRGYASCDRGQASGRASRLAQDLARNHVSSAIGPSGSNDGWAYRISASDNVPNQALGGSTPYGVEGSILRVEVTGILNPGYPRVRRSSRVYLVPFDRLLATMNEIKRKGGKISNITPAGR
jgi:phycocyanin-associated rod linker protein